MDIIEIIQKKRDKNKLTKDEIDFFISNYTNGSIKDYQASSLLMAIFLNGMDEEECTNLTLAMANSGDLIDLSKIKGVKCDKHSTGGVGDKTSLALIPLVSLFIPVAKMSGRGLSHTGGTIDKMDAMGMDTSLSMDAFIEEVNTIGGSIIGQTKKIAPADKLLYALRDVTGTVDSIPLIASSIMSKKIAAGSDAIVLDVKIGSGAFMKNIQDGETLAKTMVDIGNLAGRKTTAVLTNMEEPLGFAVGNSLEVIEAINTLKNNGPKDFEELVLTLGSHMLFNTNFTKSLNEGKKLLKEQIENGNGLKQLEKIVRYQKGNEKCLYDYNNFPLSEKIEVTSTSTGYIKSIDALMIGESAMHLGGGRQFKEDSIDLGAGIVLNKKIGDKVDKGELLFTMYSKKHSEKIQKDIQNAFVITDEEVKTPKLILETF